MDASDGGYGSGEMEGFSPMREEMEVDNERGGAEEESGAKAGKGGQDEADEGEEDDQLGQLTLFPSRKEYAAMLRTRGPAWQAAAKALSRPVARPEDEPKLTGSISNDAEAAFMKEKEAEASNGSSLEAMRNWGLNSDSPWWVEPGASFVLPTPNPKPSSQLGGDPTIPIPVVVVVPPTNIASSSPLPLPSTLPLDITTLSPSDFPLPGTKKKSGEMQNSFSEEATPPANLLPLPSSQTVGEKASQKALLAHQAASWPRLEAASRRLQEIMLSDNPEEYAKKNPIPPRPPLTVNPALRHLRGSVPLSRPQPPANVPGGRKLLEAALLGDELEVDRMIQEAAARQLRNANIPGTKECEHHPGFRDTLLSHGKKIYGEETRRVVTSISFHDLTPDPVTGAYKDERVLHFEAGFASGISLVCTDVNVESRPTQPQVKVTAESSKQAQVYPPETQRWMSFLITVPLVAHAPGVKPSLPPNMRGPIPASWVLIATPIHSVTFYPSVRENFVLRSPTGHEFIRTVKRTDYGFSRDCPPVFEFMDKEAVLGPVGTVLNRRCGHHFLNGTGLQSYDRSNDVALVAKSTAGSGNVTMGQGSSSTTATSEASTIFSSSAMPNKPVPTKEQVSKWAEADKMQARMFTSKWWREAEVSFIDDWDNWDRIRAAMKTGNCRIIVRIDEEVEAKMAKGRQPKGLGASIARGNRPGGSIGPGGGTNTGERVGGPLGRPPPRPPLGPHLGMMGDEGEEDEEEEEVPSPSPSSSGPKHKKAKKGGRKRNKKK